MITKDNIPMRPNGPSNNKYFFKKIIIDFVVRVFTRPNEICQSVILGLEFIGVGQFCFDSGPNTTNQITSTKKILESLLFVTKWAVTINTNT